MYGSRSVGGNPQFCHDRLSSCKGCCADRFTLLFIDPSVIVFSPVKANASCQLLEHIQELTGPGYTAVYISHNLQWYDCAAVTFMVAVPAPFSSDSWACIGRRRSYASKRRGRTSVFPMYRVSLRNSPITRNPASRVLGRTLLTHRAAK